MGKLEDFLNEAGYDDFEKFIKPHLTITDIGEGLATYKFGDGLDKLISGFLKSERDLAKSFKKNKEAEGEYLKKLETAKSEISKKLPKDGKRGQVVEKRLVKICKLFRYVFDEERLVTSVVKQYEKRLQHLIDKYYFPSDLTLLIMQGLFLIAVLHGISKQAVVATSETKDETGDDSKKIKPGDYKLEEVLNNPSFILSPSGYVGDTFLKKKDLDKNIFLKMLITCFVDDMEETDDMTEQRVEEFSEWIGKDSRLIKGYPQFREEVQEDPHEVMLTSDNLNGQYDPFVRFIEGTFGFGTTMLVYPYFFKGSKKKKLSVKGKEIGRLTSYTYPKGIDVFSDPEVADLDKQLKPVWFRDATNKNKSYKKISMKDLHDIYNEVYRVLLWRKIIKYIRVTYQCTNDHILVSFTTDNFDLPPQIDEEADFKRRCNANRGKILYRGTSAKRFEDVKNKGIASHARKHHDQWFGPGVYWTKEYEQALGFARDEGFGVVAMAIACDDFPNIIKDAAIRQAYREVFLMRDNQCMFIRKTAMCDVRGEKPEEIEKIKKSPDYKNVVFCKTDKEVEDWVNCK